MLIKIKRISDTGDETFGVLLIDNVPLCLTLERPYLDNQKYISCIPEGYYACVKKADKVSVLDVENRTGINIEVGNIIEDTQGCILLGSEYGNIDEEIGILESDKAFDKFMDIVPDCFLLQIEGG